MSGRIDFGAINAAALSRYPALLEAWLPGGRLEGVEYVCASSNGGSGQSFKVNTESGLWAEFNGGEGDADPVSLYAHLNGISMGEAAKALARDFGIEAVSGAGRCNGPSKPQKTAWHPVLPVPEGAPAPPDTHYQHGEASARWCYRDAEGRALGYAVRFDGPKGKAVLPLTYCRDEEGKHSWRWKAFVAPRPLYGLDRLAELPQEGAVLLVEGEKAADAAQVLAECKVACMTWPGGCKAVAKVGWDALEGRRVCLWPDADEAGFKAALDVAARLNAAGAGAVSIVLPPEDWPEGHDLADMEGWDRDRLFREIGDRKVDVEAFRVAARERYGFEVKADKADTKKESQEGTPPSVKTGPVAINISDFLSLTLPERETILSPVIPAQGLTMLYAPRGMGKTFASLSMAWGVACGGNVLRWTAECPRRVMYIDGEMPARTMQERLAQIALGFPTEPPSPDYFRLITPDLQPDALLNLASPGGQAALDPLLEGVDLLVIDNLATLARNGRENESESWLPVQAWLLDLRRRGISVLLVHHAGKGGNQRGTSAREDILDCVIALCKPSDYSPEQGARFAVHLEKARGITGDAAKPFEAALIQGERGDLTWKTQDLQDAQADQVRALLQDKLSVRDIADETGISKSTVWRLRRKIERGEI